MRLPQFRTCMMLLLMVPGSLRSQSASRMDSPEEVHRFVQSFYTWYVPRLVKGKTSPTSVLAPKSKGALFSPELAKALREDFNASSKSPDEIVGLDFDPFLNSQDPAERYEVGSVSQKDSTYWANVHGVSAGKKAENPDVVAEVAPKGDHLIFVNFHYPEGQNLLGILKTLRAERQKATK